MKLPNTKLDRALDKLYDVLSKSPPGTSYLIRKKKYLKHMQQTPSSGV